MVSFVCETCNDTLKKPKLDQHAQRCWAVYTCLDCNTTFQGTDYRGHTSCISEDQKYQKSVYKAPKKPNKNHPGAPATAAATTMVTTEPIAPTSLNATTPIETSNVTETSSNKRPREDDTSANGKVEDNEEAKKAAKKAKKAAKKAAKAAKKEGLNDDEKLGKEETVVENGADGVAVTEKKVSEEEEIKNWLSRIVAEQLKESKSLKALKETILESAQKQGFEHEMVIGAFEKAIWLGGEKPKKMLQVKF